MYAYDSANRLTGVVQGSNTYAFAYNGLGDRLRQTVNGTPTTYTLDLAAGLTQVLNDGTATYLYGLNRIGEEQPGGWQYHLGDALGSVRQLVDTTGAVTLARGYEPYGETLSGAGSGTTVFQFTGEERDGTGLTFLRSRYLDTGQGRFISRDVWGGDPTQPISYNAWLYAFANPTNLTDPSGYMPACEDIVSSWRALLASIGMCDTQTEGTLPEAEMDLLEGLDVFLGGPPVSCGVGYDSFGFVCVPIVSKEVLGKCGKGPFLLPGQVRDRQGSTIEAWPDASQGPAHPTLIRPRTRADWEWLARRLGLSVHDLTDNVESCKQANGVPPYGDVTIDDETGDIYFRGEHIGNAREGC